MCTIHVNILHSRIAKWTVESLMNICSHSIHTADDMPLNSAVPCIPCPKEYTSEGVRRRLLSVVAGFLVGLLVFAIISLKGKTAAT